MIAVYGVAALLAVNLICAILTRREANAHGYNTRAFVRGALLCGPAALLAAKQADQYAIDENSIPSHAPATAAAPTPRIVRELPAPAPAPDAPVTPTVAETGFDEVAVDVAPVAEPEEASADWAHDVEADTASQTVADWAAGPVQEADEPVVQLETPADAAAPSVTTLTPWGTRAGDDEQPAAPRSLSELAAASKTDRTLRRNQPRIEDEAEQEADAGKRRRGILGKRKKNKSAAPVETSTAEATVEEPALEPVVVNDPAVAVAPAQPTWGQCPHCHTDSYADHYGLCANCAGVFEPATQS